MVIAADKSFIYQEFLPDYIKIAEKHRIDQLISAILAIEPNFNLIDLRPIMTKAKQKEIIYHQTDTHWNRRGAHYGYLAVMNYLNKKNNSLNLSIDDRSKFINLENEKYSGDIAMIMNLNLANINYDIQPKFVPNFIIDQKLSEQIKQEFGSFKEPIIFTNKNKELPKLLAFRDSFFNDLAGFFANNFSTTLLISEQPCKIDYQKIKFYSPQVLIQQFWEGRVEEIANKC